MCLPELCCLFFLQRPWDPELQENLDLDPRDYSEYYSQPGRWWTSRTLFRYPTQLVAFFLFVFQLSRSCMRLEVLGLVEECGGYAVGERFSMTPVDTKIIV